MNWIRKLSWLQLLVLILIPLTAWAVSWSMNGFSAPSYFREAAQKLGLRITQVCRPSNASYGATRSLHKRCLAMDVGKETPASKIAALRQYGLCGEFHRKGYYGATGDHWHVTKCPDGASRQAARRETRRQAQDIREEFKPRRSGPSSSVRQKKPKQARNVQPRPVYSPRSIYADDWISQAFGTR